MACLEKSASGFLDPDTPVGIGHDFERRIVLKRGANNRAEGGHQHGLAALGACVCGMVRHRSNACLELYSRVPETEAFDELERRPLCAGPRDGAQRPAKCRFR
jgi:hypothetical protein